MEDGAQVEARLQRSIEGLRRAIDEVIQPSSPRIFGSNRNGGALEDSFRAMITTLRRLLRLGNQPNR